MATELEVIEILGLLAKHHGLDVEQTEQKVNFYKRFLLDIPVEVLRRAADECIYTIKWFPKVSEIADIVDKIENGRTTAFEASQKQHIDAYWQKTEALQTQRLALENKFFLEGWYDEDQWELLAKEFDAAGKIFGAAHVREKSRRLKRQYLAQQQFELAQAVV